MNNAELKQLDDDELVARGLAGSEAALVELYSRYRPRVFGYVWRMTNDRELADEVFAATFAAFFENLARYQPRGQLAAYLFQIARSRLSKERAARAKLDTPLPVGDAAGSFSARGDAAPDELVAAAELADRAKAVLAELPEHLREVIVLRLYDGLDFAAIAEVIGAGEATARSRFRYALEALRKRFE